MRRDEIAKLIIQYIITHPESADTLQGITEWWISRQNISLKIAEVKGLVDWLSVSGILVERRIGGDQIVYTVNKEKLPDLRELFSPSLTNETGTKKPS